MNSHGTQRSSAALVPPPVPLAPQALIDAFIAPEGKIFLLSGPSMIFPLAMKVAAVLLRHEHPVAVIDGGNRFDVHALARYARRWQIEPGRFLNRIFISRGFICYQVEAAVTERLPAFLRRIDGRAAMVLGLLDTFYDEQVRFHEARRMLDRVTTALQEMKGGGISLLVACNDWNVLPRERNQLLAQLKRQVDRTYRLTEGHDRSVALVHEPAGLVVAPAEIEGGSHGTNSADVYEHHRQRTRGMGKIPPRTPQGRPGTVR